MGQKHLLIRLAAFGLMITASFVLAVQLSAFPDSTLLDTFTGTDNTTPPNSNWTNAEIRSGSAGLDLEDNAVAPGSTGGFWGGYWNPTTFSANAEAYATIVNTGSTAFFAVCVRLANIGSGTTDGYCVETADATDDFTIYRIDNEVGTILGSAIASGGQITTTDKFGIQAVGDQICAWWSDDGGPWTQMGCRTDSTYSAGGYSGLYLNGDEEVGALDDFGAGNVGGMSQMRRRLQ